MKDNTAFANQDVLHPPLIEIGGIPVTLFSGIDIMPVPGAAPITFVVHIDDDSATEIWAITQRAGTIGGINVPPVDIHFRYEEAGEDFEHTLKGFYCIEQRYNDRFGTELVFTDCRYYSIHRMYDRRYNFRRQQSFAQMKSDGKLPGMGGDLEHVFRDRWVFQIDDYVDWSVKDNKEPWKAIEILDEILKKLYGSRYGGFIVDAQATKDVKAVNWTDVCPDNMVFQGETIIDVIDWLLLISRSNMNVFHAKDGKIYVYRLEEPDGFDVNSFIPGEEYIDATSTLLYKRDLRRFAPREYRVWFPPVVEYPIVYDHINCDNMSKDEVYLLFLKGFVLDERTTLIREQEIDPLTRGLNKLPPERGITHTPSVDERLLDHIPQITGKTPQINLWNVCRTPFNIEVTFEGKIIVFPTGTWIPVQILLKECGLLEEYLHKYWYDSKWIDKFITDRLAGKLKLGLDDKGLQHGTEQDVRRHDKRMMSVIGAIKESWWRIFMLHPTLRKALGEIEFTRSEMQNYEFNYRQPAPAWIPYIDAPSAVQMSLEGVAIDPISYNQDIPDLEVEDILKADQSPFMIQTIDPVLGIFMLEEMEDKQNVHYSFEPGIIPEDRLPRSTPEANDYRSWGEAYKEPTFRLVTFVTSSPALPNDIARNFGIRIPCVVGGTNSTRDIFSTLEFARYSWDNDMFATEFIEESPKNLDNLYKVAEAEANMADYQFMQWWVGTMQFAGFHPLYPRANFLIRWLLTDNEVTTRVTARIPTPPQTIYPLIKDQTTRRKLSHELPLGSGGK